MQEETAPSPERSLLVALLRRALFDYFGGSATERQAAQDWILDMEDEEEPFSFGWVCSYLDMDPERVRKYVMQTRLVSNRPTIEWWMRNTNAAA